MAAAQHMPRPQSLRQVGGLLEGFGSGNRFLGLSGQVAFGVWGVWL